MTTALFTFVSEYKGSTLVSQHEGKSLREACVAWKNYVRQDNPFKDQGFDPALFEKEFDTAIASDIPVSLDGKINCWDFSVISLGRKLIFVTIVETAAVGSQGIAGGPPDTTKAMAA
jgi:hypothetical protein